jgi:hypothetical protein
MGVDDLWVEVFAISPGLTGLSSGIRFLCPVSVILQPQPITDLVKESFFRWRHRSLLDNKLCIIGI